MNQSKLKNLIWDYKIEPHEFAEILSGNKKIGNLDQNWAITRVLEHLNYYDAMRMVPMPTLMKNWPIIKTKIFNKNIRDGYDFVLHRHTLSASR